jgi:hypothetical protein
MRVKFRVSVEGAFDEKGGSVGGCYANIRETNFGEDSTQIYVYDRIVGASGQIVLGCS